MGFLSSVWPKHSTSGKTGIQAKISLKLEPSNTNEHKFTFFKQAS
jgi:hypothetical protein